SRRSSPTASPHSSGRTRSPPPPRESAARSSWTGAEMYGFKDELTATLQQIRDDGLWKDERELTSPQQAHITTTKTRALNFCANSYRGLADHPDVLAAATQSLQEWGFGMASVRFICGTQELHTRLEAALSDFLGTEDTILYSSCFDANGGVFE